MDLVAMSSAMALQSVQNALSISVLQKTLNQDKIAVEFVNQSLQSLNLVKDTMPLDHVFDIRV